MKHIFLYPVVAFTIFACTKRAEYDAQKTRKSTKAENVLIIANKFKIAGLDRERTVRIYLPPGYDASNEAYAVIYAHDGQNLFDDSTSYVGEWGVDESLNRLSEEKGLNLIVVGIDNGQEKRMNELSPWANEKFGEGEGDAYMNYIVEQVKPFVDSTYRTLPDREHTAIMGSSMGGLISHYAIYRFPKIFGKAIIFSPSYWYSDKVWNFTKDNPLPHDARIWMEIGQHEGNAVDDTERMFKQIRKSGHPKDQIVELVDPEGEHNETSWRRQFVPAIQWLFEVE